MSIINWLRLNCLVLATLFILTGSSISEEVVVNAMIDFDSPSNIDPDHVNQVFQSMNNLTNVIDSSGLNATIFASGETAVSQRLFVTNLGKKPNHELALNGNIKDEKLSSMTYSEQLDLLTNAKKNIDSCHICGGKIISVQGFRPQSFDQNSDTFKVLQDLGFIYTAGFKAGTLYLPGHENDTWPYPIEGFNLSAVPISSYHLSGENIYLSDRNAKEEMNLSGSKWYDLLVDKFDEAAINGDPMVVIFNNQVSGSGDYLEAFKNFINYATSKKAKFVTTMDLVNMSQAKSSSGKTLVPAATKTSECPTCGQKNESKGNLSIGVTVIHKESCPTCNKSAVNATNTR
jgi:peptidoglycan/xylan/chitin deacetylase (PgdA/CDA1 family)